MTLQNWKIIQKIGRNEKKWVSGWSNLSLYVYTFSIDGFLGFQLPSGCKNSTQEQNSSHCPSFLLSLKRDRG